MLLALLAVVLCIFITCQLFVGGAGSGKIYTSINAVPEREVGLLLGTAKLKRSGRDNLYFMKRIDAAAELYRRGKVKQILISGDKHAPDYDEPRDMRKALMDHGVPGDAIMLDEFGFRTLDSVVRAKEVFKLTRFTIISQRDHDERALLIAKHFDLDAIAFAASPVPFHRAVGAHIHEWFARVKVVLDLYILHTRPRHSGGKID